MVIDRNLLSTSHVLRQVKKRKSDYDQRANSVSQKRQRVEALDVSVVHYKEAIMRTMEERYTAQGEADAELDALEVFESTFDVFA